MSRIWFPMDASGDIDISQRYMICVGYPLEVSTAPTTDTSIDYYRRYLLDNTLGGQASVITNPTTGVSTGSLGYFRRYLRDLS